MCGGRRTTLELNARIIGMYHCTKLKIIVLNDFYHLWLINVFFV